VIQPLFDGRNFGQGSSAYGGYDSGEVNRLIDRALATPVFDEAEKLWAEAAARTLQDAAIVPLVEFKAAYYRSSRLRNCIVNMWSLNCDMTAVWLDGDRR
jgi:peptide/nickel transport system substrate-binding protein